MNNHFNVMEDIIKKTILYNAEWNIKYVLYLCEMENYRDRRFGRDTLSVE